MHKGSLQKYKIKKYGIFNTFQKPTPPPSMEKNKKKPDLKKKFQQYYAILQIKGAIICNTNILSMLKCCNLSQS